MLRKFTLILLAALMSTQVSAQDATLTNPTQIRDNAAFVFGGQFTTTYFERSFVPFFPPYEANFIIGGGYQKFLYQPLDNWWIGAEAGGAVRFGFDTTYEGWAGAFLRYDGFVFADEWRVSPSITWGISAVNATTGAEAVHEKFHGANAKVLFYLSPEISISSTEHPENEIFYRLQHRSGAWGTLGGMRDAANAQVIGYRHHF